MPKFGGLLIATLSLLLNTATANLENELDEQVSIERILNAHLNKAKK